MIFGFVTAALLATLFTPLVLRVTKRLGLYDQPADQRRIHTNPTPRLGGAAIFAAAACTLLLMRLLDVFVPGFDFPGVPSGVVGGATLIFAVGLYDDIYSLRPITKLALQVAAALMVYAAGLRVEMLTLGPELSVSVGIWSVPLTVFWIVGVTNAVNLIDGLDGLATGIGVVALLTILIVAGVLGHTDVLAAGGVLLGTLVGFLRYNFRPARIFLGDSGSLFIGFTLAVLAVQASLKSATAVLVVVPLFALAVPILDVGVAVTRRWLRGTPLFDADSRHIHHRLLNLGFDHGHAALILYAVAAALAMLGLSLAFAPPSTVALIAGIGGLAVLALFAYGLRTLDYDEFTEAGTVLASGFGRVRRVIRDQIGAKELAARLSICVSISQMQDMLKDQALQFGFLALEISQAGDAETPPAVTQRAWKLDYPIGDPVDSHPLVLRIWCGLDVDNRPYGAERVARILGPSLERRLDELSTSAPRPQPEPVVEPLRRLTVS